MPLIFTETAAGSQLWARVYVETHGSAWLGRKAPGGGQPGWT